ncbi:cytochrome c-type biogenesis protein [Stutzerimonas nitrititolerans]|uniref:cytochrome c-type biogenesis protein n=1 Tax=Stutzerimonas nitrititolerans TaxID=2482751 RepID=UPI00289932B9|nr:cytochrome c-type biogenesis protein [Stutzerimonas nitrititolerans]
MMRFLAAALLGLVISSSALAAIDTYEFRDEAERERYRTLTEELRCPKCQNQNIADSNAPIAMDLRREIFRMLEEGQNNDQIVDFLVDRYGDFVRYNPPVNAKTLVLWYGPVALLVLGFGVLASILVRRRRANGPGKDTHTLSEAERARLATLLDKEDS